MQSPISATPPGVRRSAADLAVCLGCRAPLAGRDGCAACGRPHPIRDSILEAIGPLEGRNRINAEFYDGPGWTRFRKWERLFLTLQGGARRARMQILKHVRAVDRSDARVLEVGIGDGENLAFLPASWDVYGVDVARTQLVACQNRRPRMKGRLVWAEAEALPFGDETFDACYTIGGFNYFNDHTATLREMRRVTKRGGPAVAADETPRLHRAGIGHLIGAPAIDGLWLRGLGLDAAFAEMVLNDDVAPEAAAMQTWPEALRLRIWSRLGYCVVDPGAGPLK